MKKIIAPLSFLLMHCAIAQTPGGIATNLKLWTKANSIAVSNGTAISAWTNSAVGTNMAQATVALQPIYKNNTTDNINNNPVVQFDGVNDEMVAAGGFSGNASFTKAHFFIVAKAANNTQSSSIVWENQNTVSGESGRINVHLPWSGTTYWDAGTCCTNNRLTANYPASYAGVPQLWTFSKDLAGTANGTQKQDIRLNGQVLSTMVNNTNLLGNSSPFYIGSGGGGSYYNGQVAEVIYYLGATINAAAQNKIESYLALKYGITLDQTTAQNYTSSTGTIFWNAATNSTFNKNIFGIGIDNGSGLNQTASTSLNTAILSVQNAPSFTNGSFLIISDNAGGYTSSAVAGLPGGMGFKVANTWRVSQTGTRSTADYIFDNSLVTATGYYAPILAGAAPYILVDSNADGVYETATLATSVSGTKYTYNANLKDGARFTFGYLSQSIDFGDAPNVPTTVANNGAGHRIVSGVYLGTKIDGEADGQPTANADGDDVTGLADEDGVDFNIGVFTNGANIVQIGMVNQVSVTASVAGYINAWIDLNQNGSFNDPGERVINNLSVVAGTNTVSFNLSDSIPYGGTFMRFRFAQGASDVTAPTGLATNGEVEDYKVYVTAPLVSACSNGFQNPDFELGPVIGPSTYLITAQTNVPYWSTTAADGMIEVWSTGFNGVPAYSGNQFVELNANMFGALYQDVYTKPGTILLWHFAHRGRSGIDSCNLKIGIPGATIQQIKVGDGTSKWGYYEGKYTVPANQYITRFEFNAVSTSTGNISVGNFLDAVSVSSSFDFGDAPDSYSTLPTSNGPFHATGSYLMLGPTVTCDIAPIPSVAANTDGGDDGVTFLPVNLFSSIYSVSVKVYNNTGKSVKVAGWIDFNKNGVFDAAERTSALVATSASLQTVTLTFSSSTFSVASKPMYARFRVASDSTEILLPTGPASDGEVEDYLFQCASAGLPVITASNTGPVCARTSITLSSAISGVPPSFVWENTAGTIMATTQNFTMPTTALTDSGKYYVFGIYGNGCAVDTFTKVTINNCTVSIAGTVWNDRNGNGTQQAWESSGTFGNTYYAVVTDASGVVQATTTVAAGGAYTFATIPAYMSGMKLFLNTTAPAIGAVVTTPTYPTGWYGSGAQYGTNNLAGSGSYTTTRLLPVSTGITNITATMLGIDRTPTSSSYSFSISRPLPNSVKALTVANGLAALAGTDPEDGAIGTGGSFKILSVAAMQGNTLFYDANGNGTLDAGETLTTGSVIANYTATKLFIKFNGAGATGASFTYSAVDSASNYDATGATYSLRWGGTALPVKLVSFTAEKQGDKALLNWVTATEINNDHFDILHSMNGSEWTTIGSVKGNGNTTQTIQYTFTDDKPVNGTNYYRLRQVDIDGHTELSDIADVSFDHLAIATTTVNVYPNPLTVANNLTIQLTTGVAEIDKISIINELGQIQYQASNVGGQFTTIDQSITAGIYFVHITTTTGESFTQKLIAN